MEIQLNQKRFEAILYENGKIDLTGEMIDSMEPIRWEESDKFALKLLNEELARLLDPKIPVEGR